MSYGHFMALWGRELSEGVKSETDRNRETSEVKYVSLRG